MNRWRQSAKPAWSKKKLVEKRRELEGRVVALRQQKESMPEDLYLQELERVLLELAQVTASLEERRQ